MGEDTFSPHDLVRLKAERERADRLYNDALTALDQSVQRIPDLPGPPPPPDEHQVTPLNTLWNIVPVEAPGTGSGWRARLAGFVWRIVAPMFQRQQEFNSALVDHINRNIATRREAALAIERTTCVLGDQLHALVRFQTHLILYLQQITLFVESKDREIAGRVEVSTSDAIGGLADEMLKRWESTAARLGAFEAAIAARDRSQAAAAGAQQAAVASLQTAIDDLRTTIAVMQRSTATVKRELERVLAGAAAPSGTPAPPRVLASGTVPAGAPAADAALDSYKYVGFEDRFRGSQEEIRRRVSDYLPEFEGASDVLDVGCGRGEFLDLLREHGISARGVDINHEMVETCRARRLDVSEGDALEFLAGLPDASLGGLFAAQVVEHLQPGYLIRLLETAYHKLRPGSKIILETINPACWFAFFESYLRDITHVRPLHPDTLQYLVSASGFQKVDVRYRVPYPDSEKLGHIAVAEPSSYAEVQGLQPLAQVASTLNANADKLNRLLFTYLDYAVVAERL